MICKECKKEINKSICPNCGYKNANPNKNKIAITLLLIFLVLVSFALSIVITTINEKKSIQLCANEGQTFIELINDSKRNMELIGTFYSSSTKMNYGYSWDEEYFTNFVTNLNSTEISKEKNNKIYIDEQYECIETIDSDNEEIKRIKKQAKILYKAYEDMYSLLIEQNFTYKNFETKYTQFSNEFTMARDSFYIVIEEINNKQ